MRIRHATIALVALASVAMLAGCTGNATWNQGNAAPTTPAPPPAQLVFGYDDGATGVSPGMPVTVHVENGLLQTVSLSSNVGEVAGEISPDGSMWQNTDDLEFDKTYTLSVSSTGQDGKPVEETRTFTTVSVDVGFYWNVYFNTSSNYYGLPLDGGTFGVGQPIVARFDDSVDKKVAESTLTVTTDPVVQGSWYWINDREAHWRPQNYWAPGTKVTVTSKGLGVEMTTPDNRQLHGQENKTATFTIGPSHIAKADDSTHQMVVYVDGQAVRTIPVSMGMSSTHTDVNGVLHTFRTNTGTMVVTEKQPMVLMKPDLPKTDPWYYEEEIPLAVRITDSGIYVHAADWSVGDQGVRDVSHGCINVSPANAQFFFDTFVPGDIVEVANAGPALDLTDGLGDWNLPWDQWVAGSAL